MSGAPQRGEVWSTKSGVDVLVISSSVYNEIASEPTLIAIPIMTSEPDTGFGIDRACAPDDVDANEAAEADAWPKLPAFLASR